MGANSHEGKLAAWSLFMHGSLNSVYGHGLGDSHFNDCPQFTHADATFMAIRPHSTILQQEFIVFAYLMLNYILRPNKFCISPRYAGISNYLSTI